MKIFAINLVIFKNVLENILFLLRLSNTLTEKYSKAHTFIYPYTGCLGCFLYSNVVEKLPLNWLLQSFSFSRSSVSSPTLCFKDKVSWDPPTLTPQLGVNSLLALDSWFSCFRLPSAEIAETPGFCQYF